MLHPFDFPILFHRVRELANGNYYLPVREILDLKPGDRVLEVGCGAGQGSAIAPPGVEYVGIDTEPKYIEYAKKLYGRPGVTFEHADIHRIDRTFTKAFVMCTHHHLSDDEVRALTARLRKIVEGVVSVTDPNPVASGPLQRMLLRHDRGQYVRPIPDLLRLMEGPYRCRAVFTKDTPRLGMARLTYIACDPTAAS